MSPVVAFDVIGIPKPQGSKSAMRAKNGAVIVKESGGDAFAAWRNTVAETARHHAETFSAPLDGPLYLHVTFRFRMPQNARKADRDAGWRWKVTAPDVDKLARLVSDACVAGGLVVDDSRFVELVAEKHEVTGWTGAEVVVGRVRGVA